MRQRRVIPKNEIDGQQQRAQLVTQLWSCRPRALDGFALEQLQCQYSKVSPKLVEYELIRARQNRAGEPR